jgi:hypothetical protein
VMPIRTVVAPSSPARIAAAPAFAPRASRIPPQRHDHQRRLSGRGDSGR